MNITDSIRYIGVLDTDLDLFEGQYPISQGISYNSYLILDERVAVMDSVDHRACDQWLAQLEGRLNGRGVDYLIVSHMEPDHGGSLMALAQRYPDMVIVGNAKTFPMIKQFFDLDLTGRMQVVKEGETLCLGRHTLQFFMAPMVHWPEVMLTYEQTEGLLFSADAFGTFGDPSSSAPWKEEARRYYVNIVGKYGAQVQAVLKKTAGLALSAILPLHGPVLQEGLEEYLGLYDTWSRYEPEQTGVLVAYASIHGHTAAAAEKMAQLLRERGETVALFDLSRGDLSQAVALAFCYDRMVLAASTYDSGIFTPMADFLHRLKAKNYQNRTVALMENGTWAPMAAKQMAAALGEMKNIRVEELVVTIRSAMTEANEAAMKQIFQSGC